LSFLHGAHYVCEQNINIIPYVCDSAVHCFSLKVIIIFA
jgi:hypothetical protein